MRITVLAVFLCLPAAVLNGEFRTALVRADRVFLQPDYETLEQTHISSSFGTIGRRIVKAVPFPMALSTRILPA